MEDEKRRERTHGFSAITRGQRNIISMAEVVANLTPKHRTVLTEAIFTIGSKPLPTPEDLANQQPPTSAQSFLHLLLDAKDRESVIGDLVEKYGTKSEARGKLRANIWFCQQVIGLVLPFLRRHITKFKLIRDLIS